MIHNVFDFGDAEAKEVMVPRIDMTFVHVDSTYDDLISIFREDNSPDSLCMTKALTT
mgnify:CR=1 FL=1